MATSRSDNDGHTVIIGIDFGTTYSGVAFTWSKKIDRIDTITSWDSDLHSNADMEKAPTVIAYGSKNTVKWGYAIPYDLEQGRWFKLLLLDDDNLEDDARHSAKIKEARAYLKKLGKTAVEVIGLYLRHLWNHAVQRMVETISRELMNYSKFHIVMTLPAIWPQYAHARMREAAKLAGMLGTRVAGPTELTFISEPEAAALSTLADMDGRYDIKKGDSFVVVDCGGGTADLISYETTCISPMSVKECVKGQGGLCGAVFVDEAFAHILEKKFGPEKWTRMPTDIRRRLIHDEWEHGIKLQFDGQNRDWVISMPFECLVPQDFTPGAGLPKVILTKADIEQAFDTVVQKILLMVNQQIQAVHEKMGKSPKYVILVGGFGRSRYLFRALKQGLGGDIEILQSRGAGPWTAICRGAVIHATSLWGLSTFSVDVQTRIARASYGVNKTIDWTGAEKRKDKYWCARTQSWRAKNQMDWLLKAGDEVTPGMSVRSSYRTYFETDGEGTRQVSKYVLYSTASSAPKRYNEHVQRLCTITWDTELDLSTLPTWTNPLGKVYYRLKWELQMTVSGGYLDFAVYHNGKRQGSKHVMIDYDHN